MEKRKSHYSLEELKELFKDSNTRIITHTAFKNAVLLGYTNEEEILIVIEDLRNKHLYKAMTTDRSHQMWQDVYKITDDQDNRIIYKAATLCG